MKNKGNYIPVTYRLPPEIVEEIEKYSENTGITKCHIIIMALKKFFNIEEK